MYEIKKVPLLSSPKEKSWKLHKQKRIEQRRALIESVEKNKKPALPSFLEMVRRSGLILYESLTERGER